MQKVSIIIPNYNNEKYIKKCLESAINQDYNNIEIIVVDDGSTDNSVNIVNEIIKNNKNKDIKLICQENLNGSVARNNGIKNSSGRYALFLDSDDELNNNVISLLVDKIESNKTDLVIGNFIDINENNETIKNRDLFRNNELIENDDIYNKLVSIEPVPTNKLYDLKIIKENNISWGNVRIGQDLNFYLKYLLFCKKVYVTNSYIYKYRIINTSISRTYSLKILDIIKSLDDVKVFYKNNNKYDIYDNYIKILELRHYNFQIGKQIKFDNKKDRKLIVNTILKAEEKNNYDNCLNYTKKYKKIHNKFKLLKYFKFIYTSNIYRKIKNR